MSWKNESQRHQLASRGIKSKQMLSKGLGGGDSPPGIQVKLDLNGLTASFNSEFKNRLFFITKRYNDGAYLAFWTDSPWGRVHDQDRGWVVIKPKKGNKSGILTDSLQTYDFGPSYEDRTYIEFLKENKKEHGGYKETYNEWKMGD